MITRRKFIITAGGATIGLMAGCRSSGAGQPKAASDRIGNTDPKTALVIWYSQAGHTARMGRLVAKVLEGEGLTVTTGRMAGVDPASVPNFDLIVIGSPVYYMDVPENVVRWLAGIPGLNGKAVSAYVTFGGAGSNEVDTGWKIVKTLHDKGAVPVGMETFGNMSTYAPTWMSRGGVERILKYRGLPNEQTYEKGRRFARQILERTRRGQGVGIGSEFSFSGLLVPFDPAWWIKRNISSHRIDRERCVGCGTCRNTCPAGAIGPEKNSVNRAACLVCFGCLNNCPAEAVEIIYRGERMVGFKKFCHDNRIVFREPPELA
ncbi:MAG: 4Fe-4S binding protein [Myxococcota bacterium]|jgi:ferredoxin/flavodoxin